MNLKLLILSVLLSSMVMPVKATESMSPFKQTKQEGSLVYYSGTATLEGEFWYPIGSGDQEIIGDNVCFNVADSDSNLIPRDKDDERTAWFCFKDTQETAKELGISDFARMKVCEIKGKVTVEVTDYVVDKEETETFDVATLVKVVKKPEAVTIKLLQEDGSACE